MWIRGQTTDIQPEKYQDLFSHCIGELELLLNALIKKNADFSKEEFILAMMKKINDTVAEFKGSLHLLNFRGSADVLNMVDAQLGDLQILDSDGGLYLCVQSDEEDIKWRRVLCEGELDDRFYTKDEFDQKYVENTQIVSSLIDERLDFTLSQSEDIFISKAEADERLSSAFEYRNAIISANNFVAEQQQKVDDWKADYDEALFSIQNLPTEVSSFLDRQQNIINDSLTNLYDRISDVISQMSGSINSSQTLLNLIQEEVAILSTAYLKAKAGQQKVLGEKRIL